MELNDNIFEKIDDYLDGKMSDAQRSVFENQMNSQPELKEAIDMVRFEKDAQEYLLAQDLRAKVAEWGKNPLPKEGTKPTPKNGNSKWLLGLIAIGVLAGLLFFLNQDDEQSNEKKEEQQIPNVDPERPIATEDNNSPEESKTPEEQVAENKNVQPKQPEKSPPNPNTAKEDFDDFIAYVETDIYTEPSLFDDGKLKSAAEEGEDPLSKGKKAFVAKEYKKSVQILESIDKENGFYEAAKEPLAHAYFKTRQFGKAANLFKGITDNSSFLKDEPEWYWLLSLMADYGENKVTADSLLEKVIGKEGHRFRTAALGLKEKVDFLKK